MADIPSSPSERQGASFQAKVAGAAMVTTVAVLLACCAAFMLQQWAVAREQARAAQFTMAEILAQSAATTMDERPGLPAPAVAALDRDHAVMRVELRDAEGRTLAAYGRGSAEADGRHVIDQPVVADGEVAGHLLLTYRPPGFADIAPQVAALTAALFFGGLGVALFLARGLAHQVIAPVEQLSHAMRKVADGGDFQPVEPIARDGLFRSQAESFNHLLAKLQNREADLQRAMGELIAARDAANAANVLKSQFLANMSHEIRTPLNGVLAMADVMAMGELSAAQRERLDVIRRSGGLLLSVLNDVLDLSKIEAGKLELIVEDFDLAQAAESALEGFRAMAEAKGLSFEANIEPAAAGAWRGDADRLRQILSNLLSNAVKFTPSGKVEARFDVNPLTGALRLQVRDTGVGVAADKLTTLFQKFVQADNSATRRYGGSGLGLAICRELIQMMGGTIEAASVEGQGSTFTAEMPLARGEARPAAPAPTATSATAADAEPGVRILAAEDNPTNQQVLRAVMDSLGLSVDMVEDGQAAVDAWRAGAYDLILMDIQMPVLDGIDAARAIRAAERASGRPRTPILALTANALSHQVAEYLAVGMDAHVAKPIEVGKLYAAICTALAEAETGTDEAGTSGADEAADGEARGAAA